MFKVHELCDHFCQRYVNTLKDQMQMDMMHEERSSSGLSFIQFLNVFQFGVVVFLLVYKTIHIFTFHIH